ncbi:hypothetical protein ACOSQ3_032647 [Xanthoceras sorbifolium]
MVMATGVIDLDPKFDEPTTRIVDNAIERASVGEASADKSSTSEAAAPMVGGGLTLKPTKSFAWNEVGRSVHCKSFAQYTGCCFEVTTCGKRLGRPTALRRSS